MTRARGWAWRAMLSALAGSGLTAAGLGGPLAGGALGAEAPVSSPSPGEGPSATVTTPTPAVPGASATTQQPAGTSTSTVPAGTPQPSTPPEAVEAPTVVVQRFSRAI